MSLCIPSIPLLSVRPPDPRGGGLTGYPTWLTGFGTRTPLPPTVVATKRNMTATFYYCHFIHLSKHRKKWYSDVKENLFHVWYFLLKFQKEGRKKIHSRSALGTYIFVVAATVYDYLRMVSKKPHIPGEVLTWWCLKQHKSELLKDLRSNGMLPMLPSRPRVFLYHFHSEPNRLVSLPPFRTESTRQRPNSKLPPAPSYVLLLPRHHAPPCMLLSQICLMHQTGCPFCS